ncbi:hypothetical protein PQS32_01630 [Sphingomonas koreensis]|nr:hypothetical protein [Sphingomonas koreensis]MDC7808831.1 hypothetical protein [Sphingomonas koreensis]
MQLTDLALAHRAQLDAGELQALEDRGDIGLVSSDAIERLGNYQFEGAGLRAGEQRVEAGALVGRTGDREIAMNLGDVEAVAARIFPAHARLILGRARVLQVGREAGVDRGAGPGGCHWSRFPPIRHAQHPRPRGRRQARPRDRRRG